MGTTAKNIVLILTRSPAGIKSTYAQAGLLTCSADRAFPVFTSGKESDQPQFLTREIELTATGIVRDFHPIPFSLFATRSRSKLRVQ